MQSSRGTNDLLYLLVESLSPNLCIVAIDWYVIITDGTK